jgi:hypothetical protein
MPPERRDELAAALIGAHEAGDIAAAQTLAQAIQDLDAGTAPPSVRERAPVPESFGSLRELPGNARLYTDPQGRQRLVGPSYSTNDQKEIKRLLGHLENAERHRQTAERYTNRANNPADPSLTAARNAEQRALAEERKFNQRMNETVTEAAGREFAQDRPIATGAMQFLRGLPFVGSYVDEMAPSSQAMEDVGVSGPDVARGAMETMSQNQPVTSGALNVAGAATGMAAMPGSVGYLTPRGVPGASRVASGAMRGGSFGLVEGAVSGYGLGDDGDRLGSAIEHGLFGAGIGTALGPLTPAGVEAFANARQYIARVDDRTLARELGVSPEAAGAFRSRMMNEDFQAAADALDRAGANAMLADASPQLQKILDGMISAGGPGGAAAKRAVDERAAASSRNFQSYLDRTLGRPQGVETAQENIRQGSSQLRQQVYDAAYSRPIDYSSPSGEQIETLMGRVPNSVIRQADELMRLEGVQSRQMIVRQAPDGSFTVEGLPDVREIDYIRRALNDLAQSADGMGAMGGQSNRGRALKNLSRDLREAVADSVPEYRTALNTAASVIDEVNATQIGYEALRNRMTPEQVRRGLEGLTGPEQQAAMLGLRNAIEDQLGTVARIASDPNRDARELTRIVNMMTSRNFEQKLNIIMGPQEAQRFMRNLDQELVSIELRGAIAANSATAARQQTMDDVRRRIQPNILQTVAAGEPMRAGKKLVQVFTGQTDEAQAIRELGFFDEIATLLTQQRGQRARDALELTRRAVQGQQLSRTQAELIAAAVLAPGSLGAGVLATQTYRYNPETDDIE